MSAAAVIAAISTAVVELVKAGLMSRECARELCQRAPVLAGVLPRLPAANYDSARRALAQVRDLDELEHAPGSSKNSNPPTLADLQRVASSPSERAALRELARRARG